MHLDQGLSPRLSRRHLLGLGAVGLLAACRGAAPSGARDTLFVGDQRGGSRVVLAASRNLDNVPYKIEWSAFPNAAPLLEALNAGAIDTGIGGDAAFIFAIGSGATIKAIGAQKSTGIGPVVVVPRDSPIRTIADLPGRKIATPKGSVSHNFVLAALEHIDRPLDSVHFAFLSPSDGHAALQSGAVDGWAIWDPNAAIAEKGGARIVAGPQGLVPGCSLMFGRDGAIADKRALLADYHRRLYAGWTWADQHRDAYVKLMHEETGIGLDIWQVAAGRARRGPVPVDAALIAEQQKTADRYLRAGLITQRIDVQRGFDTSFS
jgi:sulfonate transport system substrate-binding protein